MKSIWPWLEGWYRIWCDSYKKSYIKIIQTAKKQRASSKFYNKELYNRAKRKIAFYESLSKALKNKKIDLRFEDEYRDMLYNWLIEEFGLFWNKKLNFDDLCLKMRCAVNSMYHSREFTKITHPFRDFFNFNLDQESELHPEEKLRTLSKFMRQYAPLQDSKNFKDALNKLAKIEKSLCKQFDLNTKYKNPLKR